VGEKDTAKTESLAHRLDDAWNDELLGLLLDEAERALLSIEARADDFGKRVLTGDVPDRDQEPPAGVSELRLAMAELSDAFIALPGGYGTFEEFCEVLTWTQLGLHRKPCGILNVEGYYDPLLALFDHAAAEQFVKPIHRRLVVSESQPEALVNRLLEYDVPMVAKWIDREQA